MRVFLTLVIAGLVLTLGGFALMFATVGGGFPVGAAFVGFALIILGPITFVGGLAAYALRRPSAKELAAQKKGDYRTWHFRPAGLLILVVTVGAFVALGNWAERHVPGINFGRQPLVGYLFGALCLVLLSIRKVRNFIFFTGVISESTAGDKPGEPAIATDGADHHS